MKTMPMNTHDVERLKRELGNFLPNIKSSHRVEAMARGLGFNTNAALRAKLAEQPIEAAVDEKAFVAYLTAHGFEHIQLPFLTMAIENVRYAEARDAILAVMVKYPDLNAFGFGVFDHSKPLAEIKDEIDRERQEMLTVTSVKQFAHCVEFLKTLPRRATINKSRSSYGLKHSVEEYLRGKGADDTYVTNGMFIAAAAHLGFKIAVDGPNAYFNITDKKKPKSELAGNIGKGSRSKAWRNIMVAAINAGLDQNIFGLGETDNFWDGDSVTYHFNIANMHAIAAVRDIGFGELSIHVAVNPARDAEIWVRTFNAGFLAGDGFASGWLERKNGKWLQTPSRSTGKFRATVLPVLSNITIEPKGYSDQGQVML